MKKSLVLTILMIFFTISAFSQRFAYIDTHYIMDYIPEYQAAQMELEQLAADWQIELEKKFEKIDELKKKHQAESVLLPDEIKQEREKEIVELETEAKKLQIQRFGQGGDLFTKRKELIQPIQDKIFEAVEEIATRGNYAVIFDKAGGPNMIYTDMRYDLSDDVLKHLGYRN